MTAAAAFAHELSAVMTLKCGATGSPSVALLIGLNAASEALWSVSRGLLHSL